MTNYAINISFFFQTPKWRSINSVLGRVACKIHCVTISYMCLLHSYTEIGNGVNLLAGRFLDRREVPIWQIFSPVRLKIGKISLDSTYEQGNSGSRIIWTLHTHTHTLSFQKHFEISPAVSPTTKIIHK